MAGVAQAAPLQGEWEALNGLSGGTVKALALHGHYVYAGGSFTTASGVGAVNGVARYDLYTGTWAAVGSGVDSITSSNDVRSLAVTANGDLWAGGYFQHMGSATGPGVLARWDGAAWQPAPASPIGGGYVLQLASDGSIVYVGGAFSGYTGRITPAGTWSSLGSGLNNPADSVAIDSLTGDVYFGGGFTHALNDDSEPVPNTRYVARWTGMQWEAALTGVDGPYGPWVAARGGTSYVGERSGNGDVLAPSSGAWTPLGSAPFGMYPMRSLGFAGSTLVAGGAALPHVLSWDGSSWSAIGDGVNDEVAVMATGDHGFVVGGPFSGICLNAGCSATTPAAGLAVFRLPATAPGAPTGVTATAGNGQATVSWTPPRDDGGSPVLGYAVTAGPGGATCTTTATTSCTVTGLTDGVPYTFTVVAMNAQGGSGASTPSGGVTPEASGGVTPETSGGVSPAPDASGQEASDASGSPSGPSNVFELGAMRTGRAAIIANVRVPGPGRIRVVGTRVGATTHACAGSAIARRTQSYAVACRLTPATRAERATHGFRVRLVVAYRPVGGTVRTAARAVTLARTATPTPVTG